MPSFNLEKSILDIAYKILYNRGGGSGGEGKKGHVSGKLPTG